MGPETIALFKVAQVIGTVVSAIGAIQGGKAERRQADYQSQILQQKAAQEQLTAQQEEEDYRRRQRHLLAEQRAVLGGSGVLLSEGTPLLLAADAASEIEYQALKVRRGGAIQATRLEQEAQLRRMSGKSAEKSGFMRAGAGLLTGLGTLSSGGKVSSSTGKIRESGFPKRF